MSKKDVKEIVNYNKQEIKKNIVEFLSTNCTLLDLVLGGGFAKGRMINIVGDKSSGKSILATEFCVGQKMKNNIENTYDDAEGGFNFDTKNIYGIEIYNSNFSHSSTIEDFEYNIDEIIAKKKNNNPHIYVCDSFDAVGSEEEQENYKKRMNNIKKIRNGKEPSKISGSFNMNKQKEIGVFFRNMVLKIREKNFTLLLISQVRENIGVMFGAKYKRSGGKAIDFYASQVIWLAECEKLVKKNRTYGIRTKIRCTKNKVGKPFRVCYIDILFDYGIDNVKSNINYLYDLLDERGKLKSKTKKIKWDDEEMLPETLIKHIEKNNLEQELERRVIEKWNKIEDIISSKDRKKKY
jgi:recombination protein RecA